MGLGRHTTMAPLTAWSMLDKGGSLLTGQLLTFFFFFFFAGTWTCLEGPDPNVYAVRTVRAVDVLVSNCMAQMNSI